METIESKKFGLRKKPNLFIVLNRKKFLRIHYVVIVKIFPNVDL